MTISGISYTTVAFILAEIGYISRFESPVQLLAFVDLEPSTYQSGKFESNAVMVKCDSIYLRWHLYKLHILYALEKKHLRILEIKNF